MEHPCVDCGTVQDRYRCEPCLVKFLADQHQPHAMNRTMAHSYRLREYVADCPEHGRVLHRGDNDVCLTCEPRRPDSARAVARRARLTLYVGDCPTHGSVEHEVGSGRCRECHPLVGSPKQPRSTARIEARKAGRKTYLGYCPVHVESEHLVTTGECGACVADARADRSVTPRAAARRAGGVTYGATCEIHGPAALHHVNTGRCLMCFTATGARRVR